jgi:hypothetical protein
MERLSVCDFEASRIDAVAPEHVDRFPGEVLAYHADEPDWSELACRERSVGGRPTDNPLVRAEVIVNGVESDGTDDEKR